MSPYDPRIHPYLIDESEFYEIDDPAQQKAFLLRYAVLAPSGHNAQPWAFRVTDAGIEVYADYSRRLPVSDPRDRELMLSIGTAIANLRIAAAHFGFDTTVLYSPVNPANDPDSPVAFVTLCETCNPDPQLRALFAAITKRHTNRAPFEQREIDADVLGRLCEIVDNCEQTRFVLPQERARAAELVETADRQLLGNAMWRHELAQWVRSNDTPAADGICGDAFGIPGPLAAFAPWLVRSFDVGDVRGKTDRELASNAAGLIVVMSDDDRASLLRAGEALERLLLTLTTLGVQYAFLNQPIQVPELRRELWNLVRTPKPPQLLLRIGYATPIRRAAPRRRVNAVTV
jgi:hypothetical protein